MAAKTPSPTPRSVSSYNKIPKTGDRADTVLWIALLLAGLDVLCALIVTRKSEPREKT